jgi:predicted kinase
MNFDSYQDLDLVLVAGLPGAGKSVFATKYFKSSGRKRVNRKEIQRLIHEMMEFGDPWTPETDAEDNDASLVRHLERKIIENMLHQNIKLLVDTLAVTRKSRIFYLELAKKFNKKIGIIFLDPALQICHQRNQQSSMHMPEAEITNMYVSKELPERSEGFMKVTVLTEY